MILDLTMFIEEGMTTFQAPWHPIVEITQVGRHGFEGRETRKLVLGTHTGTHVDAPLHFIPRGATLDDMDLEALVGPASVLDLHHLPARTRIDQKELEGFLGGPPPPRLLIRYDWDRKLGRKEYYREHPFLTVDACKWLVESGVRLLALDAPQPDNPNRTEHEPQTAPATRSCSPGAWCWPSTWSGCPACRPPASPSSSRR